MAHDGRKILKRDNYKPSLSKLTVQLSPAKINKPQHCSQQSCSTCLTGAVCCGIAFLVPKASPRTKQLVQEVPAMKIIIIIIIITIIMMMMMMTTTTATTMMNERTNERTKDRPNENLRVLASAY